LIVIVIEMGNKQLNGSDVEQALGKLHLG